MNPNPGQPSPCFLATRHVSARTREAGAVSMVFSVARVHGHADETPELAADWLRGTEENRFARFKVEHARRDFLAGRIAAKAALARLRGDRDPRAIEICRGIWHQPCVFGAGEGAAVTLAHSGGQAVAIAFDERLRCGIDLEERGREVADVVETQVTPAEAAWARESADESDLRWLLLWTAREALGKCFGTGLLFSGSLPATKAWQVNSPGWRANLDTSDLLQIRALCSHQAVVSVALPTEIADQHEVTKALSWLAATLS